jgi:glycosyltransferase involved in cell wall biosynthesis
MGAWQRKYFQTSFNLDSGKIEIVTVDLKNTSLSRNAWYVYNLPKLANKLNVDIVHLSFPIPFFRVFFSVPIVATLNDMYPYDFPENFGYPQVLFNRWFLRQCLSNSDGIICISEMTKERLRFYFPKLFQKKTIGVVYIPVEFSNVEPQRPREIKNINETPFLLGVAQHRKNKNLDLLIQSYSDLLKANKIKESIQLIIVGSSGPETENLQNLIHRLYLQDRVIFLASMNDGELCWLYQNCEIFLATSSTEGFCLPLAEALYFSCKVVCSDIPIFKEVGASDCIYFDLEGESIKNLSNAIVHALEQPRPSQPAGISRFSKSNSARQYLEFYSTLVR